MRKALLWLVGAAMAANGIYMLGDPAAWYLAVPGVVHTGPFNPHFVRDIGCAYLVTGAALIWFARDPRARGAALAGGAFLALHALVHLGDVASGHEAVRQLISDLPAVFVPPALALWLAWPRPMFGRRLVMLKWLIRRRLAAFEREYGYDAAYMYDILDADTGAAMSFNKFQAMARYRRDVPAEALMAAGITATMHEDCGPCTQLGVTMAERGGVDPKQIRAVATGDERAMSETTRLGYRFAKATLAHAPEADELREEIERRWGKRAVVSLAFTIASGRVYPTVKYALGHGKTCQRLTVGGTVTPVLREAA